MPDFHDTRRGFLRKLAACAAVGAAAGYLGTARRAQAEPAPGGPSAATSAGRPESPGRAPSRVAITTGDDRADNVFRALGHFEKEIAQAIGNRQVVLKPNNVAIDIPLCATHADCLRGICEFLKRIGKLEGAVIAESSAAGATLTGFDNYGYPAVAGKYGIKMVDLDQEGFQILHVFDDRDFRPHPVRMSKRLLDPNSFIISATRLKTHDRVVATLSLKNIVVGAPIKDVGFAWRDAKPGTRTDKPVTHGGGVRGINYNLFALADRLHPHLAVLDGYEGMEGNGPIQGTAVNHRVCAAGPDWLAVDRVGVELMGIDFAKLGYLNYCASAGLGEADLKKIEVLGEPIARHVKTYKLADNIEKQLIWMKPPQSV